MDVIDRDVIRNSEYIIEYYRKMDKPITNLELQKLMYFLEAIYMVATDENYLYNEEFTAWSFGPVNLMVYNQYKSFGRIPIVLEKNVDINEINLEYIENLYYLFKDFNATKLVNLSHSKDSPWNKIYMLYNGSIPKDAIIKKADTKVWFGSLIKKVPDEK